jgi:hypothetical protein
MFTQEEDLSIGLYQSHSGSQIQISHPRNSTMTDVERAAVTHLKVRKFAAAFICAAAKVKGESAQQNQERE